MKRLKVILCEMMDINSFNNDCKKTKNVKAIIISILSREWPLTARKIYNNVRKDGCSVTYQAVHKVLINLTDDGITLKEGKEYSLNPEWIKNTKKFYEKLEFKMENRQRLSVDDALKGDLVEILFENLFEFYSFALDLIEKIVEKSKGESCGNEVYHMYWALAGSKSQQGQFKKILQMHPNTYFVCRGNTFADKMLAKFYESNGSKVKLGIDCANICDTMAGGGFVIQIFFSKTLKEELDSIYENISDINSENLAKLYNHIFDKKVEVRVIIKKDFTIATEIIEGIKKRF